MGKVTHLIVFFLALCVASGIIIWWVRKRVVTYRQELEAIRSKLLLDSEKNEGILSRTSQKPTPPEPK